MNERGAALLLGLILLSAVSLIAVVAASGSILQRQMASNFADSARALESADRAEAFASAWLYSRPSIEREAGCKSACILPAAVVPPGQLPLQPEFESAGWWASHAYPFGRHPETGEAVRMLHTETEAPGWIIEELHYEPRGEAVAGTEIEGVAYYRILSRGAGGAAGIAVTESIVARPWGGDIEAAPFPPDPGPPVFCAQFEGLHDCGRLAWRRRR